mmetsp:Transcript_79192/g.224456  ORF Transcript_79192/g.224456 Transcript_79192/m.224456 type:complete len:207 (-) Transcript_79192:1017-1637(-)
MYIHTYDWSVRASDHPLEIFGDKFLLRGHLLHLGDVRPDADHALHITRCAPQSGEVHRELPLVAVLGGQRELEDGRLLSTERSQEGEGHAGSFIGRHQSVHQTLSQYLLFREAGELCCLEVELVYQALHVDANDWRIGVVYCAPQIASHALQLFPLGVHFSNVLAHSKNPSDFAIVPYSRCRVDGEVSYLPVVRVQLELEIGDVLA